MIPGARVMALREGKVVAEAVANEAGWYILPDVPGRITVIAEIDGFKRVERSVTVDSGRSRQLDLRMEVGEMAEQVSASALADTNSRDQLAQSPSQNVFNLQRRVEGVLPVRVDVPRAGSAYRFIRPLVIDEETRVSFDYRSR